MAEIRFDVLRLDGVERFGQPADLGAATLGLDEARDVVVKGHQPNAVSISLGDPGEHQSSVDRMVELVQVSRRRRHEASAVDRDHHLLTALSLDLNDDRTVAPSSRSPVHSPDVIATHIVAQASERGGGARRSGATKARHGTKTASQRQLYALDGDNVGEDRDLIRVLQPTLPAPPAFIAPDPDIDRAENKGAALR